MLKATGAVEDEKYEEVKQRKSKEKQKNVLEEKEKKCYKRECKKE